MLVDVRCGVGDDASFGKAAMYSRRPVEMLLEVIFYAALDCRKCGFRWSNFPLRPILFLFEKAPVMGLFLVIDLL